ncbi:WG repeat-containing protein [Cellulosilyticum sp. ST5]|uniref:WG repeat-containing protein n=1 Tax=Cellulosilyticum sp. ST5 TaxID=3055805 RepID=UPI0039777278
MKRCWIEDMYMFEEVRGIIQGDYIYACGAKGELIHPEEVILTYTEGEHCIRFRVGGKWGYFELETRKIIISAIYDELHFSGEYIRVCFDGKWGGVDWEGNVVIPLEWEDIGCLEEQCRFGMLEGNIDDARISIKKDGKWGFINVHVEMVILPLYDEIGYFSNGLCPVRKGEKWGYIDKDGNEIFPIILDEITPFKYNFQERYTESGARLFTVFTEAHAAVRYGHKWGFIDHKGQYKVHIPITTIKDYFSNGWMINDMGRWGIVDAALEITWQEPNKRYIIWHNRKIYFDKLGNITSERKIKSV